MIKDRYLELAKELLANSKAAASITGDHVYEPANSANRLIIDKIVKDLLLPGSRLEGWDRLAELHGLAAQGKSCLILMEHYSNFDIPNLHYLTQQGGPNGLQIADSILPMAGMKLNQESDFVRAFTEAYSRIVIYPSRSLKALEGTDEWALEKKRSRQINMAALQQMVRKKHEGHIILLFPSGTRYRPGAEETRRGLPEVDSYLRAFDYILPIGIAGNNLRLNPEGTMAEDYAIRDVVILRAGEIQEAAAFREAARRGLLPEEDPKQRSADRVMELLMDLHRQAKILRAPLLPAGHPPDDDNIELPLG